MAFEALKLLAPEQRLTELKKLIEKLLKDKEEIEKELKIAREAKKETEELDKKAKTNHEEISEANQMLVNAQKEASAERPSRSVEERLTEQKRDGLEQLVVAAPGPIRAKEDTPEKNKAYEQAKGYDQPEHLYQKNEQRYERFEEMKQKSYEKRQEEEREQTLGKEGLKEQLYGHQESYKR
ncbi:hypothetical protein J4219_03965 [Candidatus Woesearchaeota archaeon]|nr:hypothetical protein [Candidatus Woesearchaeota archaeon]